MHFQAWVSACQALGNVDGLLVHVQSVERRGLRQVPQQSPGVASTPEGAVYVSAVDPRIRGLANLDVPKMLQHGHQEERPVASRGAFFECHPGTQKHRSSMLFTLDLFFKKNFGKKSNKPS